MRPLRSIFAASLAAALFATPALAGDERPFRGRGPAAQGPWGPQRHVARNAPQRGFQHRGAHQRGFRGRGMHPQMRKQRMQRWLRMRRQHMAHHGGRSAFAQRGRMLQGRRHHGHMQRGRMQRGRMAQGHGFRGQGRGGMLQAFQRIDRNGDGVIDRREFAAFSRHHAQSLGRPQARRGGRGPQARRGAAMRQRGGRPAARAQRGQRGGQRRGAGPADRKRLQARGAAILYRLKQADADGDGKLSRSEAPELLKKRFAKLDRNEDGFLAKGELKRAVKLLTKGDAREPKSPKKQKSGKKR
ncbi:MAG: hypothetical protein QNJ90_12715 [Planctomycetota bacterium]|nr:hypothetical protein [Planctomycetota bacterium]